MCQLNLNLAAAEIDTLSANDCDPQKAPSKSFPKFGRHEIDDIYAVSIVYRKSYDRFGTFAPLGPTMRNGFSLSERPIGAGQLAHYPSFSSWVETGLE